MSPSILPSIFPFLCSLFFLSHLYYILYQNFIKSSYKLSLFHHCCCCCCQVASVVSDSVRLHRRQPTRLTRPWDSPGKNTGLGCHFLLQCVKVKREREVTRSCLTLHDRMDCSPPHFSIHGTFQARVLEWVAISISNAWKWKVRVKLLSRVRLFATPWTAAHQAPPSMGFSR